MSDETRASSRLRIKTDTAVAGGSCCKACGGLLAGDLPRCPHCGADRITGLVPHHRPSWTSGLGLGIGRLVRATGRLVVYLLLLVLAAMAVAWAYQRWFPAATPPSWCSACQGTGQTVCSTCRGRGRVEGSIVTLPCRACRGTGRQDPAPASGPSACPACQGTGVGERKPLLQACERCRGQGQVACPACRGSAYAR